MNCGNFVCGRDAHQNIGYELIGCGSNFNVSLALRYVIDETLLAPLRKKVDEERSRLNQCLNAAILLERAEQMKVPVLLHVIEKDPSQELFIPTSVMLDAMISFPNNPVSNSPAILIKALLDERNNVERYSFLPDFIEVSILDIVHLFPCYSLFASFYLYPKARCLVYIAELSFTCGFIRFLDSWSPKSKQLKKK